MSIRGLHERSGTELITGRNEVVAKVIFLHLSVILFTGGVCLSACWDTTPPEQTPPPPEQTNTPGSRHPLEQNPPGADPPGADTPPQEQTPPRADTPPEQTPPAYSSIRSTSGRYASYWNAFLFACNCVWHRKYCSMSAKINKGSYSG